MIGDNLAFDVAGPQRVGCKAAWLDRKGKGVPAGIPTKPDAIIRSVADAFLQPNPDVAITGH
jgi:FMN phosphatase YigB (HAD superfamily)